MSVESHDSLEIERERLLDAARAEFIDHGFRRTSVVSIASRAGVDRSTLFRRLGDKSAIVQAVVSREIVNFLVAFTGQAARLDSAHDRVIEAFVLGMREFRSHPLVDAVRKYEPDTLPVLLTSQNARQSEIISAIATLLSNDDLDLAAATRAAELLARITTMFLLSPTPALPVDTDDQARRFAEIYFGAILEAAKVEY